MKRKIRIIPLQWDNHNINVYVRDNMQVVITYLEYNDFCLMDADGNIFKPYACIEQVPGYYKLMFDESCLDKIRIKKYGFSTKFINIKQ